MTKNNILVSKSVWVDLTVIVMRTCLRTKNLSTLRDKIDNASSFKMKNQMKMDHIVMTNNAVKATLKAKTVKAAAMVAMETNLKLCNLKTMMMLGTIKLRKMLIWTAIVS